MSILCHTQHTTHTPHNITPHNITQHPPKCRQAAHSGLNTPRDQIRREVQGRQRTHPAHRRRREGTCQSTPCHAQRPAHSNHHMPTHGPPTTDDVTSPYPYPSSPLRRLMTHSSSQQATHSSALSTYTKLLKPIEDCSPGPENWFPFNVNTVSVDNLPTPKYAHTETHRQLPAPSTQHVYPTPNPCTNAPNHRRQSPRQQVRRRCQRPQGAQPRKRLRQAVVQHVAAHIQRSA